MKKFEEFVSAIKGEIAKQLKDEIAQLVKNAIKEEVSSLNIKLDNIEENVNDLDYRLDNLEGYDIDDLQNRIEDLEYYDLGEMYDNIEDLKSSMEDKIDSCDIENEIQYQINNLIDCYLLNLKKVENKEVIDNVNNNIEDEEEME